ncbi:MAG: FtsB family cell division protein [Gemmatimonadaceae bacterium]
MAGRVIWAAIIVGALYFAVQGGEYSTIDIVHQRRSVAAITARADSLRRIVDSLRTAERAVRTDPVTQERIAREEFGLVRGDEILYHLIPDSGPTGHR